MTHRRTPGYDLYGRDLAKVLAGPSGLGTAACRFPGPASAVATAGPVPSPVTTIPPDLPVPDPPVPDNPGPESSAPDASPCGHEDPSSFTVDPLAGEVNRRLVAWAEKIGLHAGRIGKFRDTGFGRLAMLTHPDTDDPD